MGAVCHALPAPSLTPVKQGGDLDPVAVASL